MPLTPADKNAILEKLKEVLRKQAPPMVLHRDGPNGIELIGNKPVPYGSKKVIIPGMFFSAAIIRKDMVSFHFFPIYYKQEEFESLIPNTIKYLKGKTCFNFRKPEQVNEKEINAMLKKGVQVWKKLGYVK